MLNPYELIGFMPSDLSLDALQWAYESDKTSYKAAIAAVSQARKVRPVFLEKQPRAERHAGMISTLARPSLDTAAGALLRAWLLGRHNVVVTDFLDSLGIANKQGVVESLPPAMEEEKLKQAIESLLSKHRREVVIVYLNAFNGLNGPDWPALPKLLQEDPRLQL